jgi:hypothetical protein
MKHFTIYKTETGIIESVISSDCNVDDILVGSDETIVEGYYSPSSIKFVDGSPVNVSVDFWDDVRSQRNILLQNSDWTQMSDSPLSDSKKTEWANYRQSLRDLPSSQHEAENLDSVAFPTEPS